MASATASEASATRANSGNIDINISGGSTGALIRTISTDITSASYLGLAAGDMSGDKLVDTILTYASGGNIAANFYNGVTGALIRTVSTDVTNGSHLGTGAGDADGM